MAGLSYLLFTQGCSSSELFADTLCLVCSELHENFPLVPEPIREYIDEVKEHLQYLTEYEGPAMSTQDKLAFLRETRHAFGRTALVLSGGGALGAFHVVSLWAAT